MKRAKYQLESAKVSSVSVSRTAGPLHVGQVTVFHAASASSGLPLTLKLMVSGSFTGSWSSGTGTTPQLGQWIIGIGQPQGRWRDTSQSRKR